MEGRRGQARESCVKTWLQRALVLLLAIALTNAFLPPLPIAFGDGQSDGSGQSAQEDVALVCAIERFTNFSPGLALQTYEAYSGQPYGEVCGMLPTHLPGTGAEGFFDIPVRWACADYTGAVGTYQFRVELENERYAYAATDDPATAGVDEGELPFVEVIVSEPEPQLEPAPEPQPEPQPAPEPAPEPQPAPEPTPEPDTSIAPEPAPELEPTLKQELVENPSSASDARSTAKGPFVLTSDTFPVVVTSAMPLPDDAYLSVKQVGIETARELLGEAKANVAFAYDIKILVPGEAGDTEYQPPEGSPVTVAITPAESLEAQAKVEVTHIAEDKATGETNPEVVENATKTSAGAVEFEAESFSIYIGTTPNQAVQSPMPGALYWNGTNFFADNACTSENIVTNSAGVAYTTLPALLADINGDTTISMKAGYAVADAQIISGGSHAVTLKRSGDMNGDGTTDDPYTGSLVTVSSGGSLTLSSITVDGGAVWEGAPNTYLQRDTTNNGIVAAASLISSTGSLTVNSGAYIQNNDWPGKDGSHNGGGINAVGTLTINGGAVRDCYAGHYGAGIQVAGTFNMAGGEICGTQCGTSGGAVMLGGTPGTGTVFTLTGGKIHHNSSPNSGGVCVAFGTTFIMNGGEISYNHATNGGGLYLHGSATATINAGVISYNSADRGGGCGIEADGGTLTMNGGEMTYNTATSCAGGIYSKRDDVATYRILVQVNGGTILNNTVGGASQDIYNYYAEANNVTIDGGAVGTVTLNKGDPTVLPKNSQGASLVRQVIPVPNISGITAVTTISVTASGGSTYDYRVNGQTNSDGELSVWLPEGCTVNSVTTFANGEYTTHILGQADAHAEIRYTSLEVPAVLTAALVVDGDGTPVLVDTYQWYKGSTAIVGATSATYATVVADVGAAIHVVINEGASTSYTSASVTIVAPSINVTVPLATDVTVQADGTCSASGGSLVNNSAVDVYVTNVAYAWNTSGSSDANEVFTDYTRITATLALGGTSHSFSGASPAAWTPTAAQGIITKKVGDTPGSLSLPWTFGLGTGNYVKKALAAEEKAQVATITYTVDYNAPQSS